MTTERPKVQAYLLPDIYERFTDWKKSKGIDKDSEALNRLLGEYFMVNYSDSPTIYPLTEEQVRKIVGETVEALAKKSKA